MAEGRCYAHHEALVQLLLIQDTALASSTFYHTIKIKVKKYVLVQLS